MGPWPYLYVLVGLSLASWVYFDATDRGRRGAWAWGAGVFVLGFAGVIPLLVYFSVRNNLPRLETAENGPLRLYLVTTTMASMVVFTSAIGTVVFSSLFFISSDRWGGDWYRTMLASSLSAAVVTGGIWVTHIRVLRRRLELSDGEELRALFVLYRLEVLTIAFVFGAIGAIVALWVLFFGFSAAAQVSFASSDRWIPLIGPLLAAACASGYHALVYRDAVFTELAERVALVPAPRILLPNRPMGQPAPPPRARPVQAPSPATMVPPAPSGAPSVVATPPSSNGGGRFCGSCGMQGSSGDEFCRACGAVLAVTQ